MSFQRILPKAGEGPWSLIIQQTLEPAVFDTWSDGVDLLCECGELLARCISVDQLWNISIQCRSCGVVSACDPLPPGRPLPSPTIVLHGEQVAQEPIDLQRQTLVGEAAVEQRRAEIGEPGSTFGRRDSDEDGRVDAAYLRGLIETAKEILGAELARLANSSRLSRTSKTPSSSQHGLVRAISLAETAEQSFAGPKPFIDAPAWAELRALATLAGRWRGHPEFESIRRALVHEYEHTLILLTAATYLEDHGTGVWLQPAAPGQRTPDLRIGARRNEEGYVEIKAPRALQWPKHPIARDEAEKIVKKAMKKAGTGKSGQLKHGLPSILVIGGFHLTDADLNVLRRAADVYLAGAARLNNHRGLLGILFVTVGAGMKRRFSVVGDVTTSISRRFEVRVSLHPGYKLTDVAQLKIGR